MNKRVSLTGFEVLVCNAQGLAMGITSPEQMFGDLATWKVNKRTGEYIVDQKSGQKFRKMKAYVIDWAKFPDGTYDIDGHPEYISLVDWDVWQQMEPTEYDLLNGLYVSTGKRKIKIPRVVQSLTHDKMPNKKFKLNLDTLYELYGGRDAYTNEPIKKEDTNLDHVIAKKHGGKREFGNIVPTSKKINTMKGHKSYQEVGLPPPKIIIPEDIPMIRYLKNPRNIPEWRLFLQKYKTNASQTRRPNTVASVQNV